MALKPWKMCFAAALLLTLLIPSGAFPAVLGGYEEHTRKLHVSLPMYDVTNQGGLDHVQIPGGSVLNEIGRPVVPIYSYTVLMLAGERVQSVVISEKSGFTNATGLILPVFEANTTAGGTVPTPGGSPDGWFPELELSWETWENSNGSSTIAITLYPFRYKANTTESSYSSQYALDVTYIVTSAAITGISSGKSAFDPGEAVPLEVGMENLGASGDFVVGVTILKSGTLETVDALPLRTVQGLQGASSLRIEWTGTGIEPGDYVAVAEMNDTEGHWLSTASLQFTIGIPAVEVIGFSATPQHFEIGDDVVVEVTARNTGSVEVSGSCIAQIRDGDGLVQHFQINYTGLKPRQQRTFLATWDTSNATEDRVYTALAYVLFNGLATGAESCALSTNQMPVPVLSFSPASVWTGLNITFTAAASYDPDGEISSYAWDFGDFASSNGANASHAYALPGNYSVTLTAVDSKGGEGQTSVGIQVVKGYYLNVTSNIGVAVAGGGLFPEGAVVQASAPAEVPASGIMGTLGSKHVFKQWTGASNSTESTVSVTVGYETSHYGLVAVYQEESGIIMFAILAIVILVALVVAFMIFRLRVQGKAGRGGHRPVRGGAVESEVGVRTHEGQPVKSCIQ